VSAETVSLREHLEALVSAEQRRQDERDRRYAEVALEREKALKIKETADLAALQLAREIQTYKDEKANELREQINSERGLYATQHDVRQVEEKVSALIKPIVEYVAAQQGRTHGAGEARTERRLDMGQVISILVLAVAVVAVVVTLALSRGGAT